MRLIEALLFFGNELSRVSYEIPSRVSAEASDLISKVSLNAFSDNSWNQKLTGLDPLVAST